MSGYDENLDADRLCEVADAALRASIEVGEYLGGGRPYPADLMGSPLQPDYLAPFTLWEVQQASELLLRLGEVDAPRKAASPEAGK